MEYRDLHSWDVSASEAVEVQRRLRDRVSLVDGSDSIRLVAGVDVSVPFRSKEGRAAVVVLTFPDFQVVEARFAVRTLAFPYIPGLLSFRELPVVLSAVEQIENVPDVIIVDGQGIAHPRRLGIAAHLGLLLDRPTIGCGKSPLYGKWEEPGIERGSTSPILDKDGTRIGTVLRTRTGTKPVFVSPGNKVSHESAVRVVLECAPKYRLPEPIRAAHNLAGDANRTAGPTALRE